MPGRLAVAALCCLMLVPAGDAAAKARHLHGTKLTYFDRTPFDDDVKAAAAMWNAAGTPIQLRPAHSRKRADIVIVKRQRLSYNGDPVAGLGGIHFDRRGRPHGSVKLSTVSFAEMGEANPARVDVVAHELGHAMGLPHSRTACTLMYPIGTFIQSVCPTPPGEYLCGPQREDAAALAKLYHRRLHWPEGGGRCHVPIGSAEFLDPPAGTAIGDQPVTVSVHNGGSTTWSDGDVVLTFVDESGAPVESPCGAQMQIPPSENTVAPGEVAHFELMTMCPTDGPQTIRLRMFDSLTGVAFGEIRSFTMG